MSAVHYLAVATYTARPETVDRVATLLPALAEASRQEPGNISYTVARNLEQPHVFTIVEVYDDADAFTAHRESAHFAEIGKAQIIPLLESRGSSDMRATASSAEAECCAPAGRRVSLVSGAAARPAQRRLAAECGGRRV